VNRAFAEKTSTPHTATSLRPQQHVILADPRLIVCGSLGHDRVDLVEENAFVTTFSSVESENCVTQERVDQIMAGLRSAHDCNAGRL
jgi:hypothetical protein